MRIRSLLKVNKWFVVGFLLTIVLAIGQPLLLAQAQTSTAISQVSPATQQSRPVASPKEELSANPAQLPPLPYEYSALEKAIDAKTMKLHHDEHHATYVEELNSALKKYPDLRNRSVETMLRDLDGIPEAIRTTVQNNGGGHLNHTIFWQIMSPKGGGQPTGQIAQEINKTFGSFEKFREQFNAAGGDRFGSGWVWLVRNAKGQLEITSTPNQDNPIMKDQYPIMGNDVWEHAYYLRYQNRRAEYLNNWWNVVNWEEINRRWQASSQQQ
ncbi:superoxide dismutase [Chroococcidiopsis sp. CCALA 051]|uniref:superoxide dismutase n=1 Tax=Chroococcidiopsis sp. CCALA 051 TaxID=869949 RepID=UPI000D0CC61A|nr:superoxide dismutase [Chroococcidiopsis sp. CCALA 051]PSM46148.1 superoxide dismutase [Chroococcidiopsis sp. CCALA 051]